MALTENPKSSNPPKTLRPMAYLILVVVILGLLGAGILAVDQNQAPASSSATTQTESITSESTDSVTSIISSGGMTTAAQVSTTYALSLLASDFNNVSYSGCVLNDSASGHTYFNLNMTVTNRLNATVNYVNASIIFQASEISGAFHASESYTEALAGPTNASVLRLSASLPIDNVVSGSIVVEVFIKVAANQVETVLLQPAIPVTPLNYPQCNN